MGSRLRMRLTLATGLSAAVLAVGVVPAVAGAASAGPYCGISWGSRAKVTPGMTGAPLVGVRVGRHDCFDRLVVDIAGRPAAGYRVEYVNPPYRAEGSGDARSVAGGAVLRVSVQAPAYDSNGNATVPWAGMSTVIRPDRFRADGFRTLRDLAWGGSFEGQSSFGLGIRARLPFRVLQLDGPGDGTRLVVDVAHQW